MGQVGSQPRLIGGHGTNETNQQHRPQLVAHVSHVSGGARPRQKIINASRKEPGKSSQTIEPRLAEIRTHEVPGQSIS